MSFYLNSSEHTDVLIPAMKANTCNPQDGYNQLYIYNII